MELDALREAWPVGSAGVRTPERCLDPDAAQMGGITELEVGQCCSRHNLSLGPFGCRLQEARLVHLSLPCDSGAALQLVPPHPESPHGLMELEAETEEAMAAVAATSTPDSGGGGGGGGGGGSGGGGGASAKELEKAARKARERAAPKASSVRAAVKRSLGRLAASDVLARLALPTCRLLVLPRAEAWGVFAPASGAAGGGGLQAGAGASGGILTSPGYRPLPCSLATAFLLSGASTVLHSLWAVPALPAVLLQLRLYGLLPECTLDEARPVAAALREAQLWLADADAGELREMVTDLSMRNKQCEQALLREIAELDGDGAQPAAPAAPAAAGEHSMAPRAAGGGPRERGERPFANAWFWAGWVLLGRGSPLFSSEESRLQNERLGQLEEAEAEAEAEERGEGKARSKRRQRRHEQLKLESREFWERLEDDPLTGSGEGA
jgi:hypothetical protein